MGRLICSDPACADERTVEAATLRELEALACDCGCALEIIGWPDALEAPDPPVALHARRRRGEGLAEAA